MLCLSCVSSLYFSIVGPCLVMSYVSIWCCVSSDSVSRFGLIPGIVLCFIVGMLFLVAFCTVVVHVCKCSSISSSVNVSSMWVSTVDISCWYACQLALWNCSLGVICMYIGFVVIVAIIGIWSDGVSGPGSRCRLWNVCRLVSTISGAVVLLCLMCVGKYGPTCVHVLSVISLFICLPTLLL